MTHDPVRLCALQIQFYNELVLIRGGRIVRTMELGLSAAVLPCLTRVTPVAVQQGVSTVLTLVGHNLGWPGAVVARSQGGTPTYFRVFCCSMYCVHDLPLLTECSSTTSSQKRGLAFSSWARRRSGSDLTKGVSYRLSKTGDFVRSPLRGVLLRIQVLVMQ